jgi:hypothetical protein
MMLALVIGITGCSTKQPDGMQEDSPFVVMQNKANAITEAGGLAAVGIGSSRTVNLAIDKAKTRGRTELAHIMETKIDSMKKDFSEEIGEGQDSEFNSMFQAVSKSVAHQILRGSVPKDLKYETGEGGLITAWALMVQDPKVIADAFAQQANSARAQYTRFRASQAFAELDEEVKKFDEFKANENQMIMQTK